MFNSVGDVGARRVTARRRWAAVAAASTLAIGAVAVVGPPTIAQTPLKVGVGIGDGTVAGQAFLPGAFTVNVGDSVTFAIGSDQAHTVTLGEGPVDVLAPFWPVTGFETPPADAPPPFDLGTASFDGTNFLNTGIVGGKGTTGTVTFAAAGSFPFFCAIHPGMEGVVEVVEDGPATT